MKCFRLPWDVPRKLPFASTEASIPFHGSFRPLPRSFYSPQRKLPSSSTEVSVVFREFFPRHFIDPLWGSSTVLPMNSTGACTSSRRLLSMQAPRNLKLDFFSPHHVHASFRVLPYTSLAASTSSHSTLGTGTTGDRAPPPV